MRSGLLLLLDLVFIWALVNNDTTTSGNILHGSSLNATLFTENTNNGTVYEEEENFQNQDTIHHYSKCDENFLMIVINYYCLENFHWHMQDLGEENWCDWEIVLRYYNNLTHCMEKCAGLVHCYYPNAVVQNLFVDVHKEYFILCPTKEDILPDAPASVVLMLTLLPVSVIPMLVYMVIKKSSVID